MTPLSWRTVSPSLRTLAWWLTVVQALGYTVSLVFVWHTTGLSPRGAALRYRGGEGDAADAAMHFPKSFAEMLTNTHTHLLSIAAIFAFSGLGVALAEWPSERWRRLLIAEPFAALLVSFAAMWLMRYADPRFAWLLVASSATMAIVFYAQAAIVLRALARAERGAP